MQILVPMTLIFNSKKTTESSRWVEANVGGYDSKEQDWEVLHEVRWNIHDRRMATRNSAA